jgi:hypothetical protein
VRPAPEGGRPLRAVRLAGDVVPGRPAAKREAPVAPARTLGDPALVVDADTETTLGETERGGAAGYAGADDRDVDAAGMAAVRSGRDGIFEPVRVQEVER